MNLLMKTLLCLILILIEFDFSSQLLTKSRVIGGQKVTHNKFSYQISIQVNNLHRCGGAIIDLNWVVTAAHCYMQDLNEVFVLAGVFDFTKETFHGQKRKVILFYKHEAYQGGVGSNDIALIKIDKIFDLNSAVNVINLPVNEKYPTGKGLLTGWGSITDAVNPEYPSILQSVFLPIHSPHKCFALWKMFSMLSNHTFCAGELDGTRLTCSGDSGSPLVQLISGKLTLIGIVSGGTCGIQNKPSIFVQVSFYKNWIQHVMHKDQMKRIVF